MEKNKKINLSLQVIPKVPSHIHVYDVVDKAIEVIQKSGLTYEVGPMETTMEGEIDECLAVVKIAQEACIAYGASEVMSIVKIHYRPTGVTIDEKIKKYR